MRIDEKYTLRVLAEDDMYLYLSAEENVFTNYKIVGLNKKNGEMKDLFLSNEETGLTYYVLGKLNKQQLQ